MTHSRSSERFPLPLGMHWRASRSVAVLAYHGIDDVERFSEQLAYLASTSHFVSLDQVLLAMAGIQGLPRNAVLLTFDDGERSLLENGLPLLSSRGIPALAFTVAGLVNTQLPFWWSEVEALVARGGSCEELPANTSPADAVRLLKKVADRTRLAALVSLRQTATSPAPSSPQLRACDLRQLEASGIEIGNHTLTHPVLPMCSDTSMRNEVVQAHRVLKEILGHEPGAFAYPNGNVDERAEAVLSELGYRAAFLFDHRYGKPHNMIKLRISRLRVNSDTSLGRFKLILSGIHPAIHHTLGRP